LRLAGHEDAGWIEARDLFKGELRLNAVALDGKLGKAARGSRRTVRTEFKELLEPERGFETVAGYGDFAVTLGRRKAAFLVEFDDLIERDFDVEIVDLQADLAERDRFGRPPLRPDRYGL